MLSTSILVPIKRKGVKEGIFYNARRTPQAGGFSGCFAGKDRQCIQISLKNL